MLTERTWTLCSGFTVTGYEDYLFLNDATCEDGGAEFGIIKGGIVGPHDQVESVTFSWCTFETALKHIRCALAGEYDHSDFRQAVTLRLETSTQHGTCHFCA
jgi:hypothetical protein